MSNAEQINTNAGKPKKAQIDDRMVEQHSIKDQIAADEYEQAKKAARRKGSPIKLQRMIPPGASE